MADKILCQLIDVVKTLSPQNRHASPQATTSSSSAEDALKGLYPSVNSKSPQQFDPKINYLPKKRRAPSYPAKTKSRKISDKPAKPVLKDVILLPSPNIHSVPRGLFREYLYAEGFAESAIEVSDDMGEEEIGELLNKTFRKKFESFSKTVKFTYARAIGSKIINLNNGPFTGKLLKYVSKQGPIYIKAEEDLPGEHLQRWVTIDDKEDQESADDKFDDDDDDEDLMNSALGDSESEKVTSIQVDQTPGPSRSSSSTLTNFGTSRAGDKAYAAYIQVLDSDDEDDDFEKDTRSAILASLEEVTPSLSAQHKKELNEKMKQILQDHKFYCANLAKGDQEEIIVRRSKLLTTAFSAIKEKHFNCCSDLLIQFSGEEGADAGGPRREFFRLVMREIQECSGLLEGSEGHMVFTHNVQLLEDNKYFLAGRLVGMSMVHGGPGLSCLEPVLYKLMCDLPCCLNDFDINDIVDSDIRETLQELDSVQSSSQFKSFVEKRGDFIAVQGYPSIYTAKEGHAKMIKQALLKQFFSYRISSEIRQFKNGLNDVGGLWNLIEIHPEEFQPLFTYVPNELSRSLFKSLCEIEWSPVGSNKRKNEEATIYCWEIFLKQVEDEKVQAEEQVSFKDLLKFITGADAIPPLGFQYPLTIQFYEQEMGGTRLPHASTCGLELRLPRGHEDPETFSALICKSLFNSCGFGKV